MSFASDLDVIDLLIRARWCIEGHDVALRQRVCDEIGEVVSAYHRAREAHESAAVGGSEQTGCWVVIEDLRGGK